MSRIQGPDHPPHEDGPTVMNFTLRVSHNIIVGACARLKTVVIPP